MHHQIPFDDTQCLHRWDRNQLNRQSPIHLSDRHISEGNQRQTHRQTKLPDLQMCRNAHVLKWRFPTNKPKAREKRKHTNIGNPLIAAQRNLVCVWCKTKMPHTSTWYRFTELDLFRRPWTESYSRIRAVRALDIVETGAVTSLTPRTACSQCRATWPLTPGSPYCKSYQIII